MIGKSCGSPGPYHGWKSGSLVAESCYRRCSITTRHFRDTYRSYSEAALAERQLRDDPAQADRAQIVQLLLEKLENEIRVRLGPKV
jgi:hypothetical protein